MKKAAGKASKKENKKESKKDTKAPSQKEEKKETGNALLYKKYDVTYVMGPLESMGDQYPYMVQVLEDVKQDAQTAKVGYMTKVEYDRKEKKNVYTNPKAAYRVHAKRIMDVGDFPMNEVLIENVEGEPGKVRTIIFSNTMAKVRKNMERYNRDDYMYSGDSLSDYGIASELDDAGGDEDDADNKNDSDNEEAKQPLKKMKVSETKTVVKKSGSLKK